MNLMRMRMMEFIKTIAIRTLSRRFALKMNKPAVRLTSKTLVKHSSKCIHLSNSEASSKTASKSKKKTNCHLATTTTKKTTSMMTRRQWRRIGARTSL